MRDAALASSSSSAPLNSDTCADEVVPGIANHIRKFWDPRMREAIFAYMDAGGEGIDPPVREALDKLKAAGHMTKASLDAGSSFQGT